jgi:tRNA pseudouridine55 synthase
MSRSLAHGWLVIDKPIGYSSAKVVAIVKRLTGAKRVGHGGTLDPLATGLLPIALGEATKTVSYVMDGQKAYRFSIQFGESRTTDDREGEVVERSAYIPEEQEIQAVLPEFIGDISQIPPVYSAIKQQGKRACDRARDGEEVEMVARQVRIDALKLLEYDPATEEATLEVECGKGTYVRSLGRDIAVKTGSKGYISLLRRVKVGKFTEDDAISLERLEEIVHNAQLDQVIKPVVTVLDDIPAVTLSSFLAEKLKHGQQVQSPRILNEGTVVRAMCGDRLLGLCVLTEGRLKPERMFNL